MSRGPLLLVLAAALAGVTLAGLSASQHFRILQEGTAESSYCSVSEKIDCDVVNASSFAEVLGVPNAWWGLLFYLLVGGLALSALLSKGDRRAGLAFAWLLSAASLGYCAYLAWVLAFVLDTVCLECIGMYTVSIVFAAALPAAMRVPYRGLPGFAASYARAVFGRPGGPGFEPRLLPHALAAAVLFTAGGGYIYWVRAKAGSPAQRKPVEERLREFRARKPVEVPADPAWAAWGNPDARTVLIEFSEFQCPFCRHSAFQVKPALQEFKDGLRYYFVNYPLHRDCNRALRTTMHPMACFTAKAGICAQEQEKFWPFHDELFRRQNELSRKLVLEVSQELGFDETSFLACIGSSRTEERLQRDIAAGRAAGVDGTPAMFLNGRVLHGWTDRDFVQRVVREEIARTRPPDDVPSAGREPPAVPQESRPGAEEVTRRPAEG